MEKTDVSQCILVQLPGEASVRMKHTVIEIGSTVPQVDTCFLDSFRMYYIFSLQRVKYLPGIFIQLPGLSYERRHQDSPL